MDKKQFSTKELTLLALLMALTCVSTMMIAIPTVATKGYVNLGDMIVILSGFLTGPIGGFIAGGIGSALADLFLGYAYYAPITFVVKGIEGALAGWLFKRLKDKKLHILAAILPGLFMACGYFFAECFIYSVAAAFSDLFGNIIQGLTGAVLAIILYPIIIKVKRQIFN
ncbi:MAG: ECF transporter S component [Tissierellia bacterium]|nr:ECF transporter S component [Tissierellia bacterium]